MATFVNHFMTSYLGFKCVDTLKGHSDSVLSLCRLRDGAVVSGSLDRTVRVWDPRQGCAAVKTMDGHSLWINDICEINDGRIVSVSEDETVRVWDPRKGALDECDFQLCLVSQVLCASCRI